MLRRRAALSGLLLHLHRNVLYVSSVLPSAVRIPDKKGAYVAAATVNVTPCTAGGALPQSATHCETCQNTTFLR